MKSTDTVLTAIDDALRCRDLTGRRLVVAVSGGPDSVALALGLCELRDPHRLTLTLAHVDHGLRQESSRDAAFVRRLGDRLGLPVIVRAVAARDEASRRHRGIEEAARIVRYRSLAEVVRELNAAAVLVGHTADDQVETRLLHLVRGSGLRGLGGMDEDVMIAVPGGAPLRIVRPFLTVRHRDTVAFCQGRGVEPCHDASNDDRAFTRNRLRHAVVPELRAINPRLDDSLERLARIGCDAEAFVEAELDSRLDGLVTTTERGWLVERRAWRALPAALKRALLRRAGAELACPEVSQKEIGDEAIEAAMVAADQWPAGRQLAWPGGLRVRTTHDHVAIERAHEAAPRRESWQLDLDRDGSYPVGPLPAALVSRDLPVGGFSGTLRIRLVGSPCACRWGDPWHADLDRATLEAGTLVVRPRAPGDWLVPEGVAGRKKLQDVLVDAHVPREVRDQIPLLAAPEGIVWIVGLRRDRRFLADARSRDVRCLRVEVDRPEPSRGEVEGFGV